MTSDPIPQVAALSPRSRPIGSAPVVVFVHGFLDTAAVWESVVRAPQMTGIQTLVVDLAGVGTKSSADGPFTLERFARDVSNELDTFAAQRYVLVGQSMGALVAELAARDRSESVAGLVLITPVALAGTHLSGDVAESFRGAGGNTGALRAGRAQLTVGLDDEALDRQAAEAAKIRPDVVAAYFDAWNRGHEAGREPSTYTGPTLIIRGEADGFVTEEVINAAVIPRFPAAHVAQVANAGHWPHLEQPHEIASRIASFVAALRLTRTAPVENHGVKPAPTVAEPGRRPTVRRYT